MEGRPGERLARSYESGDNYGSYQGLPVRRMMQDGNPAGYEIQWQDEWMPMDQFNDPMFQEAFFKPWQGRQRTQAGVDFRNQNPGFRGAIPGLNFGGGGGRRRGGPVRSRSGRGGGGMQYDPAMIEALIGG
jgi:hypothetical protein